MLATKSPEQRDHTEVALQAEHPEGARGRKICRHRDGWPFQESQSKRRQFSAYSASLSSSSLFSSSSASSSSLDSTVDGVGASGARISSSAL